MNPTITKIKLKTCYREILADTITPVGVYLKIRDRYPNSILLESSDYHSRNNSFSYICFNPIASIKVEGNKVEESLPGSVAEIERLENKSIANRISDFAGHFEVEEMNFDFITNGIFGYLNYDAVQYFENIEFENKLEQDSIPDAYYAVYQNVIAIDHLKNKAFIFSHSVDEIDNLDEITSIIQTPIMPGFSFERIGEERSNVSDMEYLEMVKLGKEHCQKGDVFQIVLSRRFIQSFKGDEFNVYRALRSINPSPYLFYFDYGNYKIFGSSPEAQIVVKDQQAEIHPIAGTFRRTGNDAEDAKLAVKLSEDKKENAEHVMLVDLARNDLSRHCTDVQVDTFREVQYYSHVIHLVSKVTGKLSPKATTIGVVGDTFPAGTLSGAPKYKAMQLIDQYENCSRQFYGGCIGFMDFKGNFNSAIMIRSFLSLNNELISQAGAGVVVNSVPQNELEEVNNKLGALNKALELAETL